MKRKLLVAAAIALVTGAANAAGSATITFSDIQVTLIDLSLAGDSSPSIQYFGLSFADVDQYSSDQPSLSSSIRNYGSFMFSEVGASTDQSRSTNAIASLSGDVFGSGASAYAEASDAAPLSFPSLSGASAEAAFVVPGAAYDFSLSPNTELVISGIEDSAVANDNSSFVASAGASLSIQGTTSLGQQMSQQNSDITTYGLPVGSYTNHQTLSVSFINATSEIAQGEFTGGIDASVAAPVPEPPIVTMYALAGLMLAARFAVRRNPTRW